MQQPRTKCSVRRAAQILGKSEMAVYQDVARRKVPFRKIGHRIFFFEEELMEFLNAQPGLTLREALEAK
jgi:Helix-turn-helix domain